MGQFLTQLSGVGPNKASVFPVGELGLVLLSTCSVVPRVDLQWLFLEGKPCEVTHFCRSYL